jgi:molecular chaperone DnaK (HSP70)
MLMRGCEITLVSSFPFWMSDKFFLGIDYGTARSSVGALIDDGLEIVSSAVTNLYSFPSDVCYEEDLIVGDGTVDYFKRGWGVVFDLKRTIGQPLTDPKVKKWENYWVVPLDKTRETQVVMNLGGAMKSVTPDQLVPAVIKNLADIAQSQFERHVDGIVVSVPSCLADSERERFRTIVQHGLSGLSVSILDDLTAIGLAYVHHMTERDIQSDGKTVFIVDFGAGNIDVGLIRIEQGGVEMIEKTGNRELGGRDIDLKLAFDCENRLKQRNIEKLGAVAQARIRSALLERCREAKELLSSARKATIDLTFRALGNSAGENQIQLTREAFEK